MGLGGGGEVGEEAPAARARIRPAYCRNGSKLCSTGLRFSSSGTVRSSDLLRRPAGPVFGCLRQRPERGQEAVEVRARTASRAVQQPRELCARTRRNSSRNGLASTAKRSSSCSATREPCSKAGSARKASANAWLLFGGRVEGALAVDDQPFELMVAAGERVEDDAGVVHQRAHRAFLGGEDADQLVGVFDERFERGEVGVDLFSAPVDPFGQRTAATPGRRGASWGRARTGCRRASPTVRPGCRRSWPPSRRNGAGLALGDQLHVGLAQQRLLAQDRVHVRAHRRVLAGDFERRVGAPVLAEFQRDDVTDVDAAMRTSDCSASASVRGKATVKR